MTRHSTAPRGWLDRLRGYFSPAQTKSSSSRELPFGYAYQSYVQTPGKPVWTGRDYRKFADEAYIRNVVAHRAISMIAEGAASIKWKLSMVDSDGNMHPLRGHPLLSLLEHPNPTMTGSDFLENTYSYRLIGGNAYLLALAPKNESPRELHLLRPDRVAVIAGKNGLPQGYRYTVGDSYKDYPVDRLTGRSQLLHLKNFHPLDDWYGLSPVEAAAYSIDQHNQSGAWNQALLQNGARPSGALVVKMTEHGASLSEEQYWRVKQQIDEQFSGPENAGRPILLEGGLDWKEMSLSPKDMDFIEAKHSSARDIALAFGVPPQLLGIPGDNTYANLAEARLALWEQTIIPLAEGMCQALNNWLPPMFGNGLKLSCDIDNIIALTPRRDRMWERIGNANFLTNEEKRALLGVGE